jgi:hypothetical protein
VRRIPELGCSWSPPPSTTPLNAQKLAYDSLSDECYLARRLGLLRLAQLPQRETPLSPQPTIQIIPDASKTWANALRITSTRSARDYEGDPNFPQSLAILATRSSRRWHSRNRQASRIIKWKILIKSQDQHHPQADLLHCCSKSASWPSMSSPASVSRASSTRGSPKQSNRSLKRKNFGMLFNQLYKILHFYKATMQRIGQCWSGLRLWKDHNTMPRPPISNT